ncbi:MAG: RNA polymerase sigma factor [Vulcanimicrobiota bacterium]
MPDSAAVCFDAGDLARQWRGEDTLGLKDTVSREEVLLGELIARVKEHDGAAFELLIAQTQKKAFGLAYHIIGDYHKAEDLLQEAYLRVFRSIHTLKSPRAFRAWLAQIITNLAKDVFAGQKLQEVRYDDLPEQPDSSLLPEGTLLAKEHVREALSHLSLIERTTLMLREYYELSYEELAQVLRIPLGTVKSRLNEARKKLVAGMERKEAQRHGL